mgnify:CR=1 FL=1
MVSLMEQIVPDDGTACDTASERFASHLHEHLEPDKIDGNNHQRSCKSNSTRYVVMSVKWLLSLNGPADMLNVVYVELIWFCFCCLLTLAQYS